MALLTIPDGLTTPPTEKGTSGLPKLLFRHFAGDPQASFNLFLLTDGTVVEEPPDALYTSDGQLITEGTYRVRRPFYGGHGPYQISLTEVALLTAAGYEDLISGITPPIAGYSHWYDPSDLTSITDGGGGVVSQWNDKSGNGRHLTGSNLPRTGTITQNSLNVIDFDGVDDILQTSSAVSWTGPITIYGVAKGTVGPTDLGFMHSATGISLNGFYITAGTLVDMFRGASGISGSATPNIAHVFSYTYNSSTSTIHQDGVQIASGTVGSDTASGQFGLGGNIQGPNLFYDGWLGEYVVYINSAHNASERVQTEDYLMNKWGI